MRRTMLNPFRVSASLSVEKSGWRESEWLCRLIYCIVLHSLVLCLNVMRLRNSHIFSLSIITRSRSVSPCALASPPVSAHRQPHHSLSVRWLAAELLVQAHSACCNQCQGSVSPIPSPSRRRRRTRPSRATRGSGRANRSCSADSRATHWTPGPDRHRRLCRA